MKHILRWYFGAFAPCVVYHILCRRVIPLSGAGSLHSLNIGRASPRLCLVLCLAAVLIIAVLSLLLFISLRHIYRLRREATVRECCSADRLRLIRSLLDLCYAYRESPQVFLDKFKDRVNISQLKTYDLVDRKPGRFSVLREDERLLCILFEQGFTHRELCAVFNLKKTSHLYVKYSRINKKLEAAENAVK